MVAEGPCHSRLFCSAMIKMMKSFRQQASEYAAFLSTVFFISSFCFCLLAALSACSSTGGTSVERILDQAQIEEPVDDEVPDIWAPDPPKNPSNRGGGRKPASLPTRTIALQWPLKNMNLSSKFGRRFGTEHQGVDLRSPEGTPIYAAADGVVIFASDSIRDYGLTLVIRHGPEMATLYAHASALIVKEGDEVKRGQAIAYVGETGNATGPHLHFEVRRGKKPVDPYAYITIPRRLIAQTPKPKSPRKIGSAAVGTPKAQTIKR